MEYLIADLHTYWEDLRPYVVGGASAGLFFYLISSLVQAVAIYKVCEKMHMGMLKRVLLTSIVILPFGTGVSLAVIAYDKKRNPEEEPRRVSP
ncbi:MAG: hypothetical protein FWE48_01505 [Coriobacteriia bacterium]|nr:hypothetical protein [Coriobacteriia bacterium]MCL2745757.1 hypothetical protein [Coriobacteriia bacterium]MCL2870530.1 hypothetical protein [Coriobacteriia bacterium]